eukprot:TRINITY_DN27823_c0_g1_i1.p1 TRINITY_DN27823_c0_g1~~TRINITY_DN27823_c0_g1_i1.p1  ORF type:complete len:109 (+),score=16.38 TRINITY_DN27823_c0_g1_i1:287-613(+)
MAGSSDSDTTPPVSSLFTMVVIGTAVLVQVAALQAATKGKQQATTSASTQVESCQASKATAFTSVESLPADQARDGGVLQGAITKGGETEQDLGGMPGAGGVPSRGGN